MLQKMTRLICCYYLQVEIYDRVILCNIDPYSYIVHHTCLSNVCYKK